MRFFTGVLVGVPLGLLLWTILFFLILYEVI